YGVGTLLASALGGHLADTIGRRKTIALSMFSSAAAMMLLSQARGLPAIILLTGLAGLAAELYRPASSALLADLVPAGQRGGGLLRLSHGLPRGIGFRSGHGGRSGLTLLVLVVRRRSC